MTIAWQKEDIVQKIAVIVDMNRNIPLHVYVTNVGIPILNYKSQDMDEDEFET